MPASDSAAAVLSFRAAAASCQRRRRVCHAADAAFAATPFAADDVAGALPPLRGVAML